MPDDRRHDMLDRIVHACARGLTLLGFNGNRLLWKWGQTRRQLGETSMRTQSQWRSGTGRHKMCTSCRALVDRNARACTECGQPLGAVAAPGYGRLLSNAFPGALRASSLLLLVNGFWFLLVIMTDMRLGGSPAGALGFLRHFDSTLLTQFGSGASWLALSGEWWRFVTPIFLHAGLLHFAFNSYVLLQLGPLVEAEFGTNRFWVVYMLCGIAGSALSQLVAPLVLGRFVNTIGASGAIMGLMGLLFVHGWRQGAHGRGLRDAMLRYLLYILLFSLVVRGVDHFNHAGGLLMGALLGLVVPSGPVGRRALLVWQTASVVLVLLVVVAFVLVARSLQSGV